jgi:hypothetical protein
LRTQGPPASASLRAALCSRRWWRLKRVFVLAFRCGLASASPRSSSQIARDNNPLSHRASSTLARATTIHSLIPRLSRLCPRSVQVVAVVVVVVLILVLVVGRAWSSWSSWSFGRGRVLVVFLVLVVDRAAMREVREAWCICKLLKQHYEINIAGQPMLRSTNCGSKQHTPAQMLTQRITQTDRVYVPLHVRPHALFTRCQTHYMPHCHAPRARHTNTCRRYKHRQSRRERVVCVFTCADVYRLVPTCTDSVCFACVCLFPDTTDHANTTTHIGATHASCNRPSHSLILSLA